MSLIIRPLRENDKEKWQVLFTDYQQFYRINLSAQIVDHIWDRIFDKESSVNALGAEFDGNLVGLTHFLFHDSTRSDRPSCYLEDLYVDPAASGTDATRELILRVEEAAREKNAFLLYFHTQQYNSQGRSIYDTITSPSSFIVYRISL